MGVNKDNQFIVTINKDGQMTTTYHSAEDYNTKVMPDLLANYTPEQYSVAGLNTVTPEAVKADGQYIVSVYANGAEHRKPFTGTELLDGRLNRFAQKYPEYTIQSVEGAVSTKQENPEEIYAIPWERKQKAAMDKVIGNVRKTYDNLNDFLEQDWMQSYYKKDALQNLADRAVYDGATKSEEELTQMQQDRKDMSDLRRITKDLEDVNNQLSEWTMREAEIEEFGGENTDWLIANAGRKKELEAKKAELIRQQTANPFYNKEAKRLMGISEQIISESANHRGEPMRFVAGRLNPTPTTDKDVSYYNSARRLAKQTQTTLNAPNDNENGFVAFAKGHIDTFKTEDFWTAGLSTMADSFQVKGVFEEIADKVNSDYSNESIASKMDEGYFDDALTDGQKALLLSFASASEAQALRAGNTSSMYNAGAISANSLMFMAQFILTGGVGNAFASSSKAATKAAAKGLASWLAKKMGKKGLSLAAGAMMAAETAPDALKLAGKGATALADAVVTPLLKTMPMTLMQTGLYKDYAQKLVERDENGNLKYDYGSAVLPAIRDAGLEVYSEMGLDPLLNVAGKVLNKSLSGLKGMARVNAFLSTKLDDMGKFFSNSEALELIRNAGINNYFTEMGEELFASAISSMWEPDALSEFLDADNLASMAVAFAPMALIGSGMSMANYVRAEQDFEALRPDMERLIADKTGMGEADIRALFDRQSNTLQDIADKISAVIKPVTESGVINTEEWKTIYKFADAFGQKEIAQNLIDRYKSSQRLLIRTEMQQRMGDERYIGKDKDGNATISTYIDEDGKTRFVKISGEPGGLCLSVNEQGGDVKVVDTSALDIKTMKADDYFDMIISQRKGAAERQRILGETENQRKTVIQQLNERKAVRLINNATNLREDYIFLGFNGENVIVANAATGDEEQRSIQEVANALQISPSILTDAQKEQALIDRMRKNKSLARLANDFKGHPFADGLLVRMESVGDSDGESRLIATVLRNGSQVKMDVSEDQINEFVAERRQAFADNEDTAISDQVRNDMVAARDADAQSKYETTLARYTNPDGSVREGEMLDMSPETYAQYSEQKYGKDDTDNTLANAYNVAQQTVESATQALNAEANPDRKPALRTALELAVAKLDALDKVIAERNMDESSNGMLSPTEARAKYMEYEALGLNEDEIYQLCLNEISGIENTIASIPVPTIGKNVNAYLAERQKYDALVADQRKRIDYWRSILNAPMTEAEKADAELANKRMQRRIAEISKEMSKTKDTQLLKALDDELKVVGESFIGEAIRDIRGETPLVVTTLSSVYDDMVANGSSAEVISTVMDSITNGYSIKGYYDNSSGKIFFITENNLDVADVRDTYIHEDRHRKTRQNNTVATLLDRLQLSGLSEQEQKDYLLGELRKLTNTNFYDEMDVKTIADELISYATEKIFNGTLDELGLDDKISNFVKNIYNGTEEESISPSGEFDNGNGTFRVADQRDERAEVAGAAEVAEQRPGSAERGGEEISKALSDKGLVMEGGVIMSAPLADLKRVTGYLTPNEMSDEESAVRFSVETMSPWAKNYRKYPDSEERVILALENLAERMTMNELVNGVISHGKYKYGENDGGSFAGPLRTNVEYIVTFDMDTSCPRTFQYLNYVRKIERRIGRPLTQTECVQLTEMMRVYGMQIPCVYCYAENKRQALKQYYTDYINARTKVINAKTDEEALQYMYGKSTNAEEARSNDPSIALNAAAYKVFMQWRSGNETFNPSMKMLYYQFSHDRNVVLTMLDMLKDEGEIWTDLKDETIAASVNVRLGINDKRAIKVVQEIVSEWKWDAIEGREHTDYELIDEDDLMVDQRTFALWRDMTSYAKSASSAKLVSRYIPYTDELKKLSDVQKAYINGMGGVRMHSTNDFRIDYVFDYFQFMADMAALKMFGHTYTKSPEFVRIFGNSGYKINMSIAAYEDENGNIRPNADEGFVWEEAKKLRSMFPNAGVMLMATSDNQIQMALDSDWIDMFIPFHHSGLPKAIWYNMRMWTDYTSKQNEKFYNAIEMKAALQREGVEIPKKAKAEDISKLFNEHFGIIMVYDSKGKRIKPHFLPGPTVVDGVEIPGHNNDPELYKELCRKYGVLPRFYGVKVKDKDGNTIDITEHPNYIKCIKETARTDTPQRPIQFNFDQPSEALGGMTPFDYAITELETRAMVETEKAKKPIKDIYKSLEEDPYGIIPDFINTVIKHKEETGEDYPIDYLSPETRRWFEEEGKVYDSRYKDVSTIPYHRNEAEIEGMSVNMRIAEEQAEIQKALDFVNGITPMQAEKMTPTSDQERDILSEGSVVRFSVRTKPNPKQTVPVYKLMRLMDGKLYPLYIDSNAMPIDLGVWYDADVPNLSALETLSAGDETLLTDSKGQTFRMGKAYLLDADGNVLEERDCKRSYTYTKSNGKKANGTISQLPSTEDINTLPAGQRWVTVTIDASGERAYHNVGINGSGSPGTFAMRPGWHASNLPSMWQIGKGSTKDLRDDNFVWVRGEMAAEKEFKYGVDEGMTKAGDMPTRMPVDGFYSFATNPKSQRDKKAKKEAETRGEEYKGQDWYISGAFRPVEIISDAEARNVIDEHNKANNTQVPYDYERESGKVFNAQTMQLEDKQDVVKDGGVRFQVSERGQRLFDAAKEKFGTTKDFREAGYMLPDGSMLDFSDGEPGTRTIDHRNIGGVINDKNYETRTEYMDDFIGEGAIRLIPETAAVSLAQKPSNEQKSVLRSYIYRYNGEVEVEIYDNGNSVSDAFYRAKTSPSRVLKDIDDYFEKGVIPIGNDVSFRAVGGNSGYVGYSMSRRAADARDNGAFPKTDFKRNYGLSQSLLDALVASDAVRDTEWHHTSMYGNKTTFYRWGDFAYKAFSNNRDAIEAVGKNKTLSADEKATQIRGIINEAIVPLKEQYDSLMSEYDSLRDSIDTMKAERAKELDDYKDSIKSGITDFVASNGAVVRLEEGVPSAYDADGNRLSKRNGKEIRDAAIKEFAEQYDYTGRNFTFPKEAELNDSIDRLTSLQSQMDALVKAERNTSTVSFRAVEITPEVRDEMERIAAVARVRGEYLKAPNGADTNLNPEQWAMVRTKKFKDWFGDFENDPENASKVVDENGEPLVVYHGTDATFTIFDNSKNDKSYKGFYFTDSQDMAGSYKGDIIMPVFLNIRDTYYVDAKGKSWNNISTSIAGDNSITALEWLKNIVKQYQLELEQAKRGTYNELLGGYFVNENRVKEVQEFINNLGVTKLYNKYQEILNSNPSSLIDKFKKYLKLKSIEHRAVKLFNDNYHRYAETHFVQTRDLETVFSDRDGIIINKVIDYGSKLENPTPNNVYIVYKPTQIKSATDNNGEFDPNNPDIRFKVTPAQDAEYRKAYENNDTAKAKQMVKDAAERAGYTAIGYHGTIGEIKKFGADRNGNIFLAAEKDAATAYALAKAEQTGSEPNTISAYLDLGKTKRMDARGENWDEIQTEWEVSSDWDGYDERFDNFADAQAEAIKHKDAYIDTSKVSDTNDIGADARKAGYDSVILENVYDRIHESYNGTQTDIILFNPRRIKSADPFTFDDNGNLIPLSERFNTESDDIRFKIGPVAKMKRNGVQSVMSAEEMNDFANSVISAGLDIDEVKRITEIAIANGGNYTDAVFGYLADRAKEDVFTSGEEDAIETARKLLVKQLGIEDEKLTQNELLWISYDYVHRNDDNINQQIANQRVKRNLEQAKSVQTKMSLQDYLDAAAEARDDIKAEYNALMALADSLNTIMEGMHARRAYDRLTVGRIVKLADQVLTSKLLDNATNGEIEQILGKVREATGMKDIQTVVNKLLNIIIDNNLRRLDGLLAKEMKRKAIKVDKNNVVNQGALDINGQKIMDAVKEHLTLDNNDHIVVEKPESIPDEIDEAMEDIYSNDEAISKDAELRLMGLSIARQYVDKVYTTIKEETEIKKSLDEMKKKKEAGEIDSKAYSQFKKEQTRALTDCRMERVGALTELIQRMQDMSAASHSLAMQFLQSNVERIRQIQHDANADMQGIPADEHSEMDTRGQKILNFFSNYTLNPLATFDMMLRALGRHSANGEGYLWNRFMRGWIDATSREFEGIRDAKNMLDAKVTEVFAKKMEWSDLYAMVNRMPKATVSFLNGGEMKEYEITQGNLLYIMLADQMVDGRMKLRAMGITEEQVEAIRKQMDPRFISLADWIVNEFLPSRRENYNAVHERMFGAPMSKVDNYFPLRILANARTQKIDVGNPNSQKETPSTVTGSIMKRTRNALALDILNTDAFVLVMDHVNKMEHWAAFAEWNRDISDLLSYKRFNNQLQNMETVYGAKENLVKKFRDIANIAAGSYVPNESPYDINAGKIAKYVTVAKISFRGYTAFKQLQSALAYFSEINPKYFVEGLSKGWEWSMNNLPIFEKRVKARNMGDQVISQETLPLILEKISSLGMAPNVLIDAYTVSTGAYAIYKTKYDKYIKMGFAPAAADKRAKQDAVILYNETQQSSENAFMSPVQMDRTMTAKGVSVFRNSSFGYGRQLFDAIRNLARRFKKGYERESIEFMTKQLIREGLDPDKAFNAAKSIYDRQGIKDVVRIILFGFVIPSTWTMLSGLPYLIFGDDDDKKKEMMKEYLLRGLFGPLEGLAAGTVLSEAGYQLAFGGELENINPVQMPITQDFIRLAESFGNDKVKTIHDIVGLGMQMGLGVNPQTFEDVVIAVIDACNGDLGTAREALLLGLRIISAPQSSIDELYIDEIEMSNLEAKDLTIPELAQRYAEYKKMRGAGAFTPMYERYPDLENKVMERYINRFNLKAKERLGTTDLADRYDDLAEEAKAMEERVSRLRRRAKAGDEEADQQLMDIFLGNEYGTLKRFTDQQSKVNSAIMDAVESQSLEEMREYLNLAEELKAEIVSEIDGGADSGVRNRNEFITFTKGLLPEMSKLDEQYLDEYNDNHPEFEEDKDESTKAAKAKIESNTKRIKEIDEELKKYQKELPNGKVHTFNQPARSKLNAEKRKLQSDNKEQRAILKESKSRQLEYKDYIPEDILNSPSFQVYMEMKPLGSMSGNTFKFKELRSLEKQLKNAADEDEREELQMKINAKKEELSKKMQRILNE